MMHARYVALFVLTIAAGCDKPPPATKTVEPSASASAPTSTTTTASANGRARFVALANTGDFGKMVADAASAARRDGLTPFLQFRAEWCKPCKAFDSVRDDPKMASALAGVALIQVDVDAWAVEAKNLNVSSTPTWLAIDDQGHAVSTQRIDGGAWEADIPENMAPPLDKFFHSI
ncbi:MAG: thioredoxin family protein [Kofleriaceae bacterium]